MSTLDNPALRQDGPAAGRSSAATRTSRSSGTVPASPRRELAHDAETPHLLRLYAEGRDAAVRDELIRRHERLVRYLASRFRPGGGNTAEDLVQVAYIGLIQALERFDPQSGRSFISFATPTILGVIKHYLRDHNWMLKAPRRLRELGMKLRSLSSRLESEMGRAPTMSELAAAAGVTEEQLVEAMETDHIYQPASLDATLVDRSDGSSTYLEMMGDLDPAMTALEDRDWIRAGLHALEERERIILYHRFFESASQAEVAALLGVSQMHISRLERQAIRRLRSLLS